MFETPALMHSHSGHTVTLCLRLHSSPRVMELHMNTPLLISHERHHTLFFSSTLTNFEVGEAQFEKDEVTYVLAPGVEQHVNPHLGTAGGSFGHINKFPSEICTFATQCAFSTHCC